jgi:hypothetical protein
MVIKISYYQRVFYASTNVFYVILPKKRNFLQNKTSFYLFEKVSSNDRKGLGHFPASQVCIYPVQGV